MKKLSAAILAALIGIGALGFATSASAGDNLSARVTRLEDQISVLQTKVRVARAYDQYLSNSLDTATFTYGDVTVRFVVWGN